MEVNKILLDTNAYTNFFKDYPTLEELVQNTSKIFMSPIVIGELLEGFKLGNRLAHNIADLEIFLKENGVEILNVSKETADVYSEIKINLKKKGRPIPVNDIWIAAQAMENGAVLVTYDQHFGEIDGLRLWKAPTPLSQVPSPSDTLHPTRPGHQAANAPRSTIGTAHPRR